MTSIDRLADVARKHGVVVGAATLALGAGFLAGYYFARHQLDDEMQKVIDEQVSAEVEASRRFIVRQESNKPATPEEALEKLIPEAAEALRSYRGEKEEPQSEVPSWTPPTSPNETNEMVDAEGGIAYQQTRYHDMGARQPGNIPKERMNNIWDRAKPDASVEFDYKAEVEARTDDEPYIISEDEYLKNDPENQQFNLTYFAGDNIMIDWEDDIVPDIDAWVGTNNLRFGHRSGDNRIVYVRNPVIHHDFQIALSDGSYATEVAGLDQEVGKL